MYRVTGSLGLANLHITTLSTLHSHSNPLQIGKGIAERKRFELLRLLHPVCFQDSIHDQPDSLHSKPLGQKATVLQTAAPDSYRGNFVALKFADEERFELSTIGLTNRSSTIELFIPFVDPKRLELLPFGLEDQCTSIMLRIILFFCWPGEIRTHNSRCKRPVL